MKDILTDMPQTYEKEPMMTDVFAVFDLDRTFLNTSRFADATMEILARKGVEQEKISDIKAIELRERGNTFDLISEIRQRQEEISIDDFLDDPEQYIYTGVPMLLRQTLDRGVPYTILTYGGQDSQRLKIAILERVLGYKVHTLITGEKNKAAWIHDHSKVELGNDPEEVRLVLPAELTDGYGIIKTKRVVILDDKSENFDTDNPLVTGILIDNNLGETKEGATAIWDLPIERILEA